jgi:hypothetical protein
MAGEESMNIEYDPMAVGRGALKCLNILDL